MWTRYNASLIEEDEEAETESDKQDDESTDIPGTEETKEPEEDSNPLVLKALIEKIEKAVTKDLDDEICPELKGVISNTVNQQTEVNKKSTLKVISNESFE